MRSPAVHRGNFRRESPVNGFSAQFTVGRQQPVVGHKNIWQHGEIPHLPVVRQIGIDGTKKLMSSGNRPIDIVRNGKAVEELIA